MLSNGHGSMLIYSLLHLTGYDLPMEELKNFRQLHSKTPGHPEVGYRRCRNHHRSAGQGIANAVGMAIAEKRWRRSLTVRATTSSTTTPTPSWATAA